MTSFFLALLLPFAVTLLIPLAHAKLNDKMHIGWLVIFVPALVFWRLLSFIPTLVQGDKVYYILPWIPSYQINLAMQIDGLSLLFGLIISGIGILVVLYSIYYLSRVKEDLHNFYVYILPGRRQEVDDDNYLRWLSHAGWLYYAIVNNGNDLYQ